MAGSEQHARRQELAATDSARAAQTRQRIVDALDEVLRSGRDVSVAAVCARAEVGRSTFYTHFASIGDVVAHVLDGVFDEIAARDIARRSGHAIGRRAITEAGLQELIAGLAAHQAFFTYALSAHANEQVRQRLVRSFVVSIQASIRVEKPDADETFVQIASEFLAGGIIGVLVESLASTGDRDPRSLVRVLVELLPAWMTDGEPSA